MKRLKTNKGLTIVEIVVVMVVFGILQAAAFTFFRASLNITNVVSATTNAQSNMRLMLSTVQRQARVAEKAKIVNITSGSPGSGNFSGYGPGALAFHFESNAATKKGTLKVYIYDGGAVKELTNDVTGWQSKFPDIEGLKATFSRSDVDGVDSSEKYAVAIALQVDGTGDAKPTILTDSFYLGNLEDNKTVSPDGEELSGDLTGNVLIIQPATYLSFSDDFK